MFKASYVRYDSSFRNIYGNLLSDTTGGAPSHVISSKVRCEASPTGYHEIKIVIGRRGDIRHISTPCGLDGDVEVFYRLGIKHCCSFQAKALLKSIDPKLEGVEYFDEKDLKDPILDLVMESFKDRAHTLRNARVAYTADTDPLALHKSRHLHSRACKLYPGVFGEYRDYHRSDLSPPIKVFWSKERNSLQMTINGVLAAESIPYKDGYILGVHSRIRNGYARSLFSRDVRGGGSCRCSGKEVNYSNICSHVDTKKHEKNVISIIKNIVRRVSVTNLVVTNRNKDY